MKKILIIAVVVVLVAIGVVAFLKTGPGGNTASAIGDGRCATVSGPTFEGPRYYGPLIDTHYHIPNLPEHPLDGVSEKVRPVLGRNVTISNIVCTLSQEGTEKVFAFFPVYKEGQTEEQLAVVKETMENYPGYFVPFIMAPDADNDPGGFPTVSAGVLGDLLNIYPGLFQGFGESGLYAREGGAEALPPDSKRLQEIYPVVREHNLLVYFHLGEGQQASFERTLSENPDINFIFHGDQLVKYEHGGQNLTVLDQILSRHSNAFYGIDELYGDEWWIRPDKSKEDFFAYLENYEELLGKDLDTWKGFIERHPTQVLWGTDRSPQVLWSHDTDAGHALSNYGRAFIARLSPAVQENFAYKNAERLFK